MKKSLSAIRKAFQLVWSVDRLYPFLLLTRSLLSSSFPLYLSFCASSLVNEMAGEKRVRTTLVILAFLLGGVLLSKVGTAVLDWNCSSRYMKIQDSFIAKNSMKAMKMEYSATEDAKVLDLYGHVWLSNLSPGTILEKVFSLTGNILQLAGCIGVILHLGMFLLGVTAVFVAFYYWLEYWMGLFERRYAEEVVLTTRSIDYCRQCMGDVSNVKDIRLYYPESFFLGRLHHFQGVRMEKQREKELACGRVQSIQSALQMLQTMILYMVLIHWFLKGDIQIGYFSLAVSSITIFMNAVNNVSGAWNQILRNEVFLGHLDRFQKLPERTGRTEAGTNTSAVISFKDVWFRYPGAEEYALRAINVELNAGEILTIVGENGSGKTTFVKLMLGLYHPTKGEILLNGIPVDEYSEKAYRKAFSPVFQDFQLFAYSIRENLVFEGNYNKNKIEEMLDGLQILRKVACLPEGLEQCVGKGFEENGVELSGGERQKLAIARALLRDSLCLVLDEPTAALDPIAETELYKKIRKWAGKRACVFITHRLSGVYFSDQVLFFQNGTIAEKGTCQELINKKALFYQFYELQAQFYEG